MSIHNEIRFEDEICSHLSAHGWLYDSGSATLYDRPSALFPPDLIAWVAGTALRGALRRRGKTITFFTDARPDPTGPRRMELMRMFNGPARMVLDGNGDLLVAGDEHWLAGRVRRGR